MKTNKGKIGLINLSEATFIALHSLFIVAQSYPQRLNVNFASKIRSFSITSLDFIKK